MVGANALVVINNMRRPGFDVEAFLWIVAVAVGTMLVVVAAVVLFKWWDGKRRR